MKWKPKVGEIYYKPCPSVEIASERYAKITWYNDDCDKSLLKRNLVCKTKKEAIRKANIMLKALKNETK